jgi:outer membrane scaffolding protein for murein synthesis (MipA/OmpV family)
MLKTTTWRFCVLAAALGATTAGAEEMMDVESAPTMIGLGIGAVPQYPGSEDMEGAIAPIFRYTFSGRRYVSWVGSQGSLNLLDSYNFRLGPALGIRRGRDEDVDDEVVARMQEIDPDAEAGVFAEYVIGSPSTPRNRLVLGARYLSSSGRGRGIVNARWWQQVAPQWDIHLGVGLTGADKDYNDYYFGVNSGNRGTSGLPSYTAGSGVYEYYFTAGAAWYPNRNWIGLAGIKLGELSGDAKDSPIVLRGDKAQASAFVGAVYLWR